MDSNDWYDSFAEALEASGYDGIYDTPAFDFLSSTSDEALEAEKKIDRFRREGASPAEVVSMLEARDDFWR